jgi:carboxypeptidase PM20D1
MKFEMPATLTKGVVMLAATVIGLAGIAVIQTVRFVPADVNVEPGPAIAIPDGAAERLAGALRIRTISTEDPSSTDTAAFQALHSYLERSFPRVHAALQRETVANHSLLYTWMGTDPTLRPMLLAGHLHVVPVEAGTQGDWQEDPFSGRIKDGFIWGRGAIDNKSAVLGILEAVELLLGEGFRPTRTVYIAYGHDEEIGGANGAREIASLLTARGVTLEMALDEGGVLGAGVLPNLASPVALVGVAEKGFLSVELSVRGEGGHSSLPPPQGAIGILSTAIARLEQNPMTSRLDGATRQLFDAVGPHLPLAQRAAFANLWMVGPLVLRNLEGSSTTNAMVRTTTAATLFQAGTKDNVLPSFARAVVNSRILPGDDVAGVMNHVRRVVNDSRVDVQIGGRFSSEPSAVSSSNTNSFQSLARAIRSVFPDAIVAPYLVVVATDARYYAGLTGNIYRFLPLRLASDDLRRMHGIDERVGIENYESAIRTYRQLFLEMAN